MLFQFVPLGINLKPRRTMNMRKSIITTLVISIVCLLVGGILIGVSLYQMTNPFTYSYDMGNGFFSYTMKYVSNVAVNSVYYEAMFRIGELLFLSAVILLSAALIAHVIADDSSSRSKSSRNCSRNQKVEPVVIPVMEETPAEDKQNPEEN